MKIMMSGPRNMLHWDHESVLALVLKDINSDSEIEYLVGARTRISDAFIHLLKTIDHKDVTVYTNAQTLEDMEETYFIKQVEGSAKECNFDYHRLVERAMMQDASAALFLWDGRDNLSFKNMWEFLSSGKEIFLYLTHKIEFHRLQSCAELLEVKLLCN